MLKIAAVNIDTSHPLGFAQVMEKSDEARYVAVYDDSFRSKAEIEGFVNKFSLDKIYDSLEEIAKNCDIGFIHGCDWDDHIRCALPFINQKKPVFIDKPMVGNIKDCNKLLELYKNGAVILGSSSARYAYEIQEFLNMDKEERGEILHVNGTCGMDNFNYGIHVIEAIDALVKSRAISVTSPTASKIGNNLIETTCITYENGCTASCEILTGVWQPFTFTVITTKNTFLLNLDSSKLYEALIKEICKFMRNEENLIADVPTILNSVKILLAAKLSREKNGEKVEVSDLEKSEVSYDGKEFAKAYAETTVNFYS